MDDTTRRELRERDGVYKRELMRDSLALGDVEPRYSARERREAEEDVVSALKAIEHTLYGLWPKNPWVTGLTRLVRPDRRGLRPVGRVALRSNFANSDCPAPTLLPTVANTVLHRPCP